MKKFFIAFLTVLISLSLLYGCSEEGPTINTNGGTTNNAPNKPKTPHPSDSSRVDTTSIVVLTWVCSDPDPNDTVTYDVYISNDNPPGSTPVVTGLTNPSYGLGIVYSRRTYFWKVVARDNHGATSTSNTWRFNTYP